MRPELSEYTPIYSGKVRELYEIDDETLLMVATDRISAYDHVLGTPIPDKGRVLTAMSAFFFDALDVPNHLAGPLDDERIPAEVLGRAMVVRRLDMVQAECVARGYLTGSGITEYRESGTVCGIELPDGLTPLLSPKDEQAPTLAEAEQAVRAAWMVRRLSETFTPQLVERGGQQLLVAAFIDVQHARGEVVDVGRGDPTDVGGDSGDGGEFVVPLDDLHPVGLLGPWGSPRRPGPPSRRTPR